MSTQAKEKHHDAEIGLPKSDLDAGDNDTHPAPKKPNAFEKLMSSEERSSKRAKLITPKATPSSQHLSKPGRDGLGVYLRDPSSFPSDVVLYYNSSFVVIRDKFPKSSVHLLVLPCNEERNTLHPFFAFQDETLLASTKAEVEKVKTLVAEELRRLFGKTSAAERARRDAIASGAEEIPAGRDWSSEVIAGVHAGPSMNHLHVHVLSRDMMSPSSRHRKHYNSFNTSFFVGLEELPLDEGDSRWRNDRAGGLREDLKCWRCGASFENKFERLKKHLGEEFDLWKAE